MYRIDSLLKQGKSLFHTGDLALLWGMSNKNTLYTTIKRYVQKGILIQIHKGFYATKPISEIDPLALGISTLHTFAYVSCEYVLAKEGVIFQQSPLITLVSSVSKRFTVKKHEYLVRKLKDELLFNDYGLKEANGVMAAEKERAIADLVYFNPKYYFDSKNINWKKVRQVQKEVGYK